jgi:hypothetical protein
VLNLKVEGSRSTTLASSLRIMARTWQSVDNANSSFETPAGICCVKLETPQDKVTSAGAVKKATAQRESLVWRKSQ